MKTIFKKMYWWLIYTVSNLRFVIISRKRYWVLRDKAAELGKKIADLKTLQSKYDFVVNLEKESSEIVESLTFERDSLKRLIDALNAKISELEKIAANYAYKKELAKARRKKYEAKKRLHKKEVAAQVAVSEPVYQVAPMSEVEKFARENLGRKVILTAKSKKGGSTCFIAGYSKSGTHVLVGFETIGGWSISEIDTHIVKLNNHKSYWFAEIDEIVFN